MITFLVIKNIRRSYKNKKERFDITNLSLKDISKIIKEFEDFTAKGYVRKRSKKKPNGSNLYPARQIEKCMVRFNMRIGSVRTQID